jgi:hypothetical protein
MVTSRLVTATRWSRCGRVDGRNHSNETLMKACVDNNGDLVTAFNQMQFVLGNDLVIYAV